MTGNLLSANQLTAKGFSLLFREGACEIKKNKDTIAIAELESGLYHLRQSHKVYAAVTKVHNENCIHNLHKRFGHRDPDAIRKLCSANLMEGLKLVECGIKQTCTVCLEGKFSRLPFPKKSESRSEALCGLGP